MGKKSRRQREEGGAVKQLLKPYKRFPPPEAKWGPPTTPEALGQHAKLMILKRYADQRHEKYDFLKESFQEFFTLVVYRQFRRNGLEVARSYLQDWLKWAPHWRRIRRRICDQCGRRANLTEPRYLVCSGCGVARYCCEECQIADWPHHQSYCEALSRQKSLDAVRELRPRHIYGANHF